MASKTYSWQHGNVHYDKRGMGDPLLLVHDIYPGASHDEFHRNIAALARHFTVYAIDLLGFGDSDMPRMTYTAQLYQHLLRDFVVEVIGGPTTVMASGVSCGAAVSLAVYNDPLVRRLVLIDPQAVQPQPDEWGEFGRKLQQFLLGTLSMGTGLYETLSSEPELRRFLRTRYSQPKNVTDDRVAELHDRASQRHALHGFISHMTGHLTTDILRWLRHVRCEVLVIWGKECGPAPTKALTSPAAWSRGKRIEIIENAAHWPHEEQSAKVNKLVAEFLAAD